MHKLADLIVENIKELETLESLNNGTSISATMGLMQLSALWIRYYAGFADKLVGTTSSLVVRLSRPTHAPLDRARSDL